MQKEQPPRPLEPLDDNSLRAIAAHCGILLPDAALPGVAANLKMLRAHVAKLGPR